MGRLQNSLGYKKNFCRYIPGSYTGGSFTAVATQPWCWRSKTTCSVVSYWLWETRMEGSCRYPIEKMSRSVLLKTLTHFSRETPKRVICKQQTQIRCWRMQHLIRVYSVCIKYRNCYREAKGSTDIQSNLDAQTPMTRLPWLIWTRFLVPTKFFW